MTGNLGQFEGDHLHGDDPPARDDCKAHGCAFYLFIRAHRT